jgi:hypothetical protein
MGLWARSGADPFVSRSTPWPIQVLIVRHQAPTILGPSYKTSEEQGERMPVFQQILMNRFVWSAGGSLMPSDPRLDDLRSRSLRAGELEVLA